MSTNFLFSLGYSLKGSPVVNPTISSQLSLFISIISMFLTCLRLAFGSVIASCLNVPSPFEYKIYKGMLKLKFSIFKGEMFLSKIDSQFLYSYFTS